MNTSIGILVASAGWVLLWWVGGWWIARRAFALTSNEEWVVGAGIGLVLETWFANLLPRIIPAPLSFWLSAVLVFVIGLLFWLPFNKDLRSIFQIRFSLPLILSCLLIIYSFTMIGRGLGLFDDYQNLPLASRLAMGDIPPHFPLNPSLRFGYHYFTLLFSGQLSRVMGIGPWLSNDLARGIVFGLGIVLIGLVAYRFTRNKMVSYLSCVFAAFTMGTRWLLVLLPPSITNSISLNIHFIDSTTATAPSLFEGLVRPWQVGGAGPFPFPFAFLTGVNFPDIFSHNGIGFMGVMVITLLLLTFNRWKGWKSAAVTTILISSLGLIEEINSVLLIGSMFLFIFIYMIIHKTFTLPKKLVMWSVVLLGSIVMIILQGGVISEVFYNFTHPSLSTGSYLVDYHYIFTFPPVLVSQQLGSLNLFNPSQLLIALLEFGPIFLIIPLLVSFGIRSFKAKRWFEVSLILAAMISLVTGLFFVTGGTVGISTTSRFYESPLRMLKIYAVPLLFFWLQRKKPFVNILAWSLAGISILGGVVLFGVEAIAAQRPVYADFINQPDAEMYQSLWNTLPQDALIFDHEPNREATILGRFTKSSNSWYSATPEWELLVANPDPYELRKSGFTYMYLDSTYKDSLSEKLQIKLKDPCVILVKEVVTSTGYYVELLDIRSCTR